MPRRMKATLYLKSGVVEVGNLRSFDWELDSRGVRTLTWESMDVVGDQLLYVSLDEIVAVKITRQDPSSQRLYVAAAGLLCIVTAVVAHAIYLSITT